MSRTSVMVITTQYNQNPLKMNNYLLSLRILHYTVSSQDAGIALLV